MTNTIAVIAAHPDDEVLGCGGTLARLARQGAAIHVLLLADGESSRTATAAPGTWIAARNDAAERACSILGCASVSLLNLPDNRLDTLALLDVVKHIEGFIQQHRPTILFTHHAGDVNIDHRIVHDAVIAACRPQPQHPVRTLLFFEVPSSTEWRPSASGMSFQPDWFYDISTTLEIKLVALDAYACELRNFPHPRSKKAVESLATWRGASVGVAAAEGFMLGRILL